MWENACYLLSDERRAAVFQGLKSQIGLNPDAIWKAPGDALLPLARMGGMRPETRVFRWREIARITLQQFDGNLDGILDLPYPQAQRALHRFPNIGEPGAQKILMFCGKAEGLPLESNGLRVLQRVGYGRPQKNYGTAYRSVQDAVAPELPRGAPALSRAHLLLRQHGKTLCRTNRPSCLECPLLPVCQWGSRSASARLLA
jgi:endonuclease III